MQEQLVKISEKMFECQRVCNECFDACLKEDNVQMMAECIRLDRECADICAFASTAITRESSLATDLIALCATICQACGKECEKHEHDHCQRCAKVCLECAELCHNYA